MSALKKVGSKEVLSVDLKFLKMEVSPSEMTAFIRSIAVELGFSDVGISKAQKLSKDENKLTEWLEKGHHGEMDYMSNHFEKRLDPTKLVPGAKSVISLSYNYYTETKQLDPDAPIVSKYALGKDYHKVLKKRLKKLFQIISNKYTNVEGRFFVDSAPVMERAWARESGLGWIGKNTMLIHPKKGSYFFLSELIINQELVYDEAIKDHCGRCRRCIDACPTDAIHPEGYLLFADKCISYATIEKKGDIPESFKEKMENQVFGCDICIEVCPWNRFSSEHNEDAFKPKDKFLKLSSAEWESLDEKKFEELFNGTAVRRAKFAGIKRNLAFLKKL